MTTHTFISKLLVSNYNKEGTPRLRVALHIDDYSWICANGNVKFLHKMVLERSNGQSVNIGGPRISNGTKNGKYTPHYITVPAEDVKKYGFQKNEPVKVTVEW